MISGFEVVQLKIEITKITWDKDPEGHTNLGKVYKESSGVSGHAGWIIKSCEDLWNEFSTQQVSHENRHLQCKFRAQALQHDCQIQASEWWINPLFTPLTNKENTRNKEFEVYFLLAWWFEEFECCWHSESSSFQLWVQENTLLFKPRMGYSLPYRSSLSLLFGLSPSCCYIFSLIFPKTSWRWTFSLQWNP